jgi:hypothetical protein
MNAPYAPVAPTERYYRHRLMKEHVEHLVGMLAAVALSLDRPEAIQELAAMQAAAAHLSHAADALQEAEREASCSIAPDLIEEQLRLSLELISRSPERMRAAIEPDPCVTCGYVACICPKQEE